MKAQKVLPNGGFNKLDKRREEKTEILTLIKYFYFNGYEIITLIE